MRRAVITGIGVTAPGGTGCEAFWDLLVSGRTATRPITAFDASGHRCTVAAECDFDPVTAGLSLKLARRTDRLTQLALVSTREAVADSGLEISGRVAERTAVSLGCAIGATTTMEAEYAVMSDGGKEWLVDASYSVPHLHNYFLPSSLASEVAIDAGSLGVATVVSNGCTSGIDAVGNALELIRESEADVVITGGSDAPISPITLTCFDVIKATSPYNDDPAASCRPFDRTRAGLVLGEGAATLVLEEYEHAKKRGARIYAEVAGHSVRCNSYHMTGLKPDGLEMAEAMRRAMAEAKVNTDEVHYINAHGSGTKQNDRHETAAFKRALGQYAYTTPVSGIKASVGHSLGAIGSIEIVACALAMRHSVIPPTANLHEPDPECDLDYVPLEARPARVDTAITVGSGFGGFQSALLLANAERSQR